jgi:hypothetical protein
VWLGKGSRPATADRASHHADGRAMS